MYAAKKNCGRTKEIIKRMLFHRSAPDRGSDKPEGDRPQRYKGRKRLHWERVWDGIPVKVVCKYPGKA